MGVAVELAVAVACRCCGSRSCCCRCGSRRCRWRSCGCSGCCRCGCSCSCCCSRCCRRSRWRGGRRPTLRDRVDGGQGINSPVSERVVRNSSVRYTGAGLSWAYDHTRIGCVLQDHLRCGDVACQLWTRRPEECDHAHHVWPGHRGARQVGVASVAAVQGRAHVYPRCGNIRLEYVGRVEGARSAAAEAGQRVGCT